MMLIYDRKDDLSKSRKEWETAQVGETSPVIGGLRPFPRGELGLRPDNPTLTVWLPKISGLHQEADHPTVTNQQIVQPHRRKSLKFFDIMGGSGGCVVPVL